MPPPRIAIRRGSAMRRALLGRSLQAPIVRGSVAHARILTRMSEGPFAPFVPATLAERLAGAGRQVAGPDGWRTAGVVLVADITGFTALTERLAERGPGGAETLAGILDASFGDVIDRIHAHGGDVVSFAGDAILAVWPASADGRFDDPVRPAGRSPRRRRARSRSRRASKGGRRSKGSGSGHGGRRHRPHLGRRRRRGPRRVALGLRRTAAWWGRTGGGPCAARATRPHGGGGHRRRPGGTIASTTAPTT